MVIDNVFRKKTNTEAASATSQAEIHHLKMLANPLDRLAAAIIDISIVLFPLILLLSAPIKKILMSAVLTQNEVLFAMSVAGIGLVTLFTIIIYQTLFVHFLGGTIGKKIFHLKVVNIWDDNRVSISDAFFRSLIWTLETLFLLIPHLAVFSDSRRRPLHDRLANTMVINPSKKSVLPPSIYEITFAKAILSSVLAIVLVVILQQVLLMGKNLKDNDYIGSLIGEGVELCEEVDWALETWPETEKSTTDARVKIALALFAAGEAGKECLKTEVDFFQLNNQTESSVAYLGQAFVYSSDPDRSNKYLKRICDVDPYSPSCAMARIVENWSDSDWDDVDLGFTSMGNNPPIHISVWAIRHYTKQRKFERAAAFLDSLSPQKALSAFLAMHRVKVLWGLHKRSEVRVIADTAMENLPEEDRLRMSTWLCRREFYNENCDAFNMGSCQVLGREVENSVQNLLDPDVALLTVLRSQCQNDAEEIRLLADTYMSLEMKKFIYALEYKQSNASKSLRLLTELIEESKDDSELNLQARMELIEVENTPELLEDLKKWLGESPSEGWGVTGAAFMRRLNQEKLFSQTEKIGARLYEAGFNDDFVLKPLVVALHQLGNFQQAWGLASTVKLRNPKVHSITGTDNSPRAPASFNPISQYQKVESDLEKMFARSGK